MQKLYQSFKKIFQKENQTDHSQIKVQNMILQLFKDAEQDEQSHVLSKDLHYDYQYRFLQNVGIFSLKFDPGHPQIMYWMMGALQILKDSGHGLSEQQNDELVDMLKLMQIDGGLFAGGQYQNLHLASSFGALCTIILIGTKKAYSLLADRHKIKQQLVSLKDPNQKGNYQMSQAGESDIRAIYVVVCICKVVGLINDPEIFEGVAKYIIECQTYEGGFGSQIGTEAHGGHSILALSCMVLMDQLQNINVDKLLYWLSNKQCEIEGGFHGRTNKLVDSCYSYWQAASFKILMDYDPNYSYQGNQLYSQEQLQKYIILCCQDDQGGLVDKPGKRTDIYHTFYSLTGLSISQQTLDSNGVFYQKRKENQIKQIDPIFCLDKYQLNQAIDFYRN